MSLCGFVLGVFQYSCPSKIFSNLLEASVMKVLYVPKLVTYSPFKGVWSREDIDDNDLPVSSVALFVKLVRFYY